MGKRRGKGEGSIYQTKDGRWRASVELGWEGRRRRRKTLSGRTRGEVAAKLREVQSSVAQGLPASDDRVTVQQWLDQWSSDVLPGTVSEGTLETYERTAKRLINPHLGRTRLTKLTAQRVQTWHRSLASDDLRPRTIRRAHAVLSVALTAAERWGLIARNVAKLVTPPPLDDAEHTGALSPDEARALLAAAKGTRIEGVVTVGLSLGLRRGEALGLRWEDINLERGTLTVQGSLVRRKGRGLVLSTPKTTQSGSTIPLPDVTRDSLRERRRRQAEDRLAAGSDWEDHGYVFTTSRGTPIDPVILRREFLDICARAEIGHRRFHDLRHSAATLLYEQGVPLEVISDTLRHAGVSITKDVYAHFRPELQRSAADAIDTLLR